MKTTLLLIFIGLGFNASAQNSTSSNSISNDTNTVKSYIPAPKGGTAVFYVKDDKPVTMPVSKPTQTTPFTNIEEKETKKQPKK